MFDLTPETLAFRAMMLIPMVLSLSVHEWAHAWSAFRLGDDTAAREGRLTLNPISHIDPIGTLLLPMLGVPFGWAKPVPVNPARFARKWSMRSGMALTAAAGPISNILIALASAITFGLGLRFLPEVAGQTGVRMLLLYLIQLNVALALFNLIPVPPLDGSRVIARYIPARFERQWDDFIRFSPMLLFVVIAVGGRLLARPIGAVTEMLYNLIRTIVGA
ncbi:MAG: site-2 protease family protein [Myxococcota bacterium]